MTKVNNKTKLLPATIMKSVGINNPNSIKNATIKDKPHIPFFLVIIYSNIIKIKANFQPLVVLPLHPIPHHPN